MLGLSTFQPKENNMFQTFKKYRAIQSYHKNLWPYLANNYGEKKYYTPDQVRSGADSIGLNPMFVCYGMAMYTSLDNFNEYYRYSGHNSEYETMHNEISNAGSNWFGAFFNALSDSWIFNGGSDGYVGVDGGGDCGGDGDCGD